MQPAYHLLNRQPRIKPETKLRIVFFGFAGGSITSLVSLAKQMPDWIEVWGAEYPGRGLRWKADLINHVHPLLDDLAVGLEAFCDKPLVLLGYSMGAHIAYRLALRFKGRILGAIAASAKPPCVRVTDLQVRNCDDNTLIDSLRELGGIPQDILNNQVIMESFIPVVRADLSCCQDLNELDAPPIDCPLLMLHGDSDLIVNKIEAAMWLLVGSSADDYTTKKAYAGGHFFHRGIEPEVASDIANWITKLLPAQPESLSQSPSCS